MLRGIQKASSGWVGKSIMAVVMGLLVVSFAIWGIGDIFRGFGSSHLAEIGDTKISTEQFRMYYSDRLSQFGRRMGRSITPDQARALGLDRQILAQLVADTALDQKARDMSLGVSDAQVSEQIVGEAAFRGINGKFDRARFEYAIREAGFTEARFVQEQRQVMMRSQIARSLTSELTAPVTAQNAINEFRNEKRNASIVTLGAEQAGELASPTPEVLQNYFEQRKALFRAPETRKVTLLSLTPEDLARWEVVSDEDASAYYEQHKGQFGSAEKRHLRQIVFEKEEDANAASEKIAQGASFDDIVKQLGRAEKDTDLGMVAKSKVFDPAVANAAFALKEGDVSKPVKGQFGFVLVQAVKVEPASQQSYQQAAAEIKRTIALDRSRQKLGDLRDKLEDERAAGSTLAEAAKKLGLTTKAIESIDRSGRDPGGAQVAVPRGVDLVSSVFASDVGVDNEALQHGNGWLWYDVVGITPSHERTLDQVKEQVERRWRADEIASRLKAKADEMLEKLKAGGTLAELAQASSLTVEAVEGLQRGQPKEPVSRQALDAIFQAAKGGAGTAEGTTATSRIVFVVTEVIDPPLDAKSTEATQAAETLARGYGEDILGEYVARLEKEIGIEINQAALQQVIGGSANQ